MFIPLGTIVIFLLLYAAFSAPPRPHIDPWPVAPPPPTPESAAVFRRPTYLWLPLGLVAFVVLSLLAHTLFPR